MIVFPMAGMSSRFTKAGYNKPKYMLTAGGKSLFTHSVDGFSDLFQTHPFLFIYRDIQETGAFIRREVERMGIKTPLFVELKAPTAGQAETVALGLQQADVQSETPVTIFNIDTIRPAFQMPQEEEFSSCDGWLEVFRGSGDNWSFVGPQDAHSNKVERVTEKNPISDLCCTGLYHFARAKDFLDAFAAESLEGPSQANEFYVAPLFNRLLAQNADLRFALIPSDDVIFSGVPQEYEALKQRYET